MVKYLRLSVECASIPKTSHLDKQKRTENHMSLERFKKIMPSGDVEFKPTTAPVDAIAAAIQLAQLWPQNVRFALRGGQVTLEVNEMSKAKDIYQAFCSIRHGHVLPDGRTAHIPNPNRKVILTHSQAMMSALVEAENNLEYRRELYPLICKQFAEQELALIEIIDQMLSLIRRSTEDETQRAERIRKVSLLIAAIAPSDAKDNLLRLWEFGTTAPE